MSAFVRRAALLRPSENEFLPRRRRKRSGSHHPTTILKQSASIFAHKLLAASIASHRFEDLFGLNFNVGDNNSNSNGSNHVASSAVDCARRRKIYTYKRVENIWAVSECRPDTTKTKPMPARFNVPPTVCRHYMYWLMLGFWVVALFYQNLSMQFVIHLCFCPPWHI